MTGALPEGLLLSWYGDDFTGSAAVMEVLTFGGVESVLFLDTPTPEQLAEFPDCRAVGIAGLARSQTPAWMDANLPPVFEALAQLGAPLTHYKVCSTLDSAPGIGSIGQAINLAEPVLGGAWYPTLVAAPPMGRWQAFGHLFAAAAGRIYRLDRHPVMSRHPVTPMSESDVALHLSRQTELPAACLDTTALGAADGGDAALAALLAAGNRIVTLDSMDDTDLAAAGRLIWERRLPRMMAVGSQGVEYALLAYWRQTGALPPAPAGRSAGAVPQIAAVSGSISATTATQMSWAEANGFSLISFDAAAIVSDERLEGAIVRAVEEARRVLSTGRSVLIHSARGPDDPAVQDFRGAVSAADLEMADANARLGRALGRALDRVLSETDVSRAVVSGGDTSGHASLELGVYALTALAPTVPGAALCRAHGRRGRPLELALKGGQMGGPDYFGSIRQGGGASPSKS